MRGDARDAHQPESKGAVAVARPADAGPGRGDSNPTANAAATTANAAGTWTADTRKVSLTRTLSGRSLYIVSSQVGGSMPMLKDREGHICKPAAQAEKEFYEELPKVYPFLVRFVPRYFGCCTVNIHSVLKDINSHLEAHHNNHTTRVYADGTESQKTPTPVKQRWDVFSNRRHKKVKKDADGNVQFIMLEDVTRNHDFSNVIDVKLGSEQYADQLATVTTAQAQQARQQTPTVGAGAGARAEAMVDKSLAAKLARAAQKCNQSTSGEFGFRINGMQIYREDKGVYKVVDKYDCRQLDLDGADRVLLRFLKYPTWDYLGQLRWLISDLSDLAAALRRTSWRYYGLSLLLSYDPSQVHPQAGGVGSGGGDDDGGGVSEQARVDIRLIDFAKCERRTPHGGGSGSGGGCSSSGSDSDGDSINDPHESVVKGIENLTSVLRGIERRHTRIRRQRHRRRQRRALSAVLTVVALAGGLVARFRRE